MSLILWEVLVPRLRLKYRINKTAVCIIFSILHSHVAREMCEKPQSNSCKHWWLYCSLILKQGPNMQNTDQSDEENVKSATPVRFLKSL